MTSHDDELSDWLRLLRERQRRVYHSLSSITSSTSNTNECRNIARAFAHTHTVQMFKWTSIESIPSKQRINSMEDWTNALMECGISLFHLLFFFSLFRSFSFFKLIYLLSFASSECIHVPIPSLYLSASTSMCCVLFARLRRIHKHQSPIAIDARICGSYKCTHPHTQSLAEHSGCPNFDDLASRIDIDKHQGNPGNLDFISSSSLSARACGIGHRHCNHVITNLHRYLRRSWFQFISFRLYCRIISECGYVCVSGKRLVFLYIFSVLVLLFSLTLYNYVLIPYWNWNSIDSSVNSHCVNSTSTKPCHRWIHIEYNVPYLLAHHRRGAAETILFCIIFVVWIYISLPRWLPSPPSKSVENRPANNTHGKTEGRKQKNTLHLMKWWGETVKRC